MKHQATTDVIGMPLDEAMKLLTQEMPKHNFHPIEEGSSRILSFDPSRVWVWYNPKTQIVVDAVVG